MPACAIMGMGVVWTSPGSGGVDKGSTGSGGGTFGLVAMAIFQGFWWDGPGWLGGSESSGRWGRSRIIASPTSSRPSMGRSRSKAKWGSSLTGGLGTGLEELSASWLDDSLACVA